MTFRWQFAAPWITLGAAMVLGCSSDERLVEMAETHARRQQSQNEVIARQSEAVAAQTQKIADAAQQMVEKDATSRQELIAAQENLHTQIATERANLDRQRDSLDQQRQTVAAQRLREPIIAEVIRAAAFILAGLLPLVLVAYALSRLDQGDGSQDHLCELLIEEVIGTRPQNLILNLPDASSASVASAVETLDEPPSIASDQVPAPF